MAPIEAVARRGRVRLRVRVRLHPDRSCPDLPHHPSEQGQLGSIVRCECRPGGPSHPCLVELDSIVARRDAGRDLEVRRPLALRYYAPDELDVLNDV